MNRAAAFVKQVHTMLIRVNENLIHQCIIVVRAYRKFIHWTYSRLGRRIHKVIPSSVIVAVHHEFPEADGIYTGFRLAEL